MAKVDWCVNKNKQLHASGKEDNHDNSAKSRYNTENDNNEPQRKRVGWTGVQRGKRHNQILSDIDKCQFKQSNIEESKREDDFDPDRLVILDSGSTFSSLRNKDSPVNVHNVK